MPEFSGKKALITGGMGFIGSNLARRLVTWGAQVRVVDVCDSVTGANLYNLADIVDRVDLKVVDIGDEEEIRPLLQDQDFIFNLAGRSGHLESMHDPFRDLQVNAVNQLKLLELCRKVNPGAHLVYASTRQVYGRTDELPISESQMPAPTDYNGISKRAGELYHLVCHQVYGTWTSVLRMTNVYGPRMRVKDDALTFVGNWIRQILNGEELSVFGDGHQIRDLNYVDDVIDALLLCVTNPTSQGQVYNLGGEAITLKELAALMIEINRGGSYRLVEFPSDRKRIDIGNYVGDYRKIRKQLNWEPKIDLREGLELTLSFYRNHGRHYW